MEAINFSLSLFNMITKYKKDKNKVNLKFINIRSQKITKKQFSKKL